MNYIFNLPMLSLSPSEGERGPSINLCHRLTYMSNPRQKWSSQSGSVLVMTLFIAFIFGFFLFYYLNLASTQRNLMARSQAWNSSLTLAEAGAEEALAQLNPAVPLPVVDRTANGWGAPSAGIYGPMNRTMGAGTYGVIYNTNKYPIIYSTGYVAVASSSAILSRTIRVATTNIPLFTFAMAAENNLNFNGNNVTTDSFNSAPGSPFNTNGYYNASHASTNGDIGSVSGVVNVGNANVNGSVFLSPTGTDSIKNNGTVTGNTYYNFNPTFPNVTLPAGYTTWVSPPLWVGPLFTPTNILGTTYNFAFYGTNDYKISGLGGSVYVGPNASIRLYLINNASPSVIRVSGTSTNAGHLTIYMDGPSFTLSGNDTIDGGNAANLAYFGTTNNTSITFSGNAAFTGTIYAPEAAFTLGGGGPNTYDFVGSSVTSSVTINGHFNFHYDENLINAGPLRGYAANSWREL
ncbi:MAG TPA: hypothetical protein VG146_07055 [Verrucomicrobiae bacterium]|nr:hypothetical protein [Verrucomicrobiae bacterium]